MKRALAVLVLSAPLLIAPAPAQANDLGGYTLLAEAAPIAVQIYEQAIPIPAEPQLEFDLCYSRVKYSSGPTGRAVSSLMWPGDVVGYGLPTLLNNPDANYPAKIDAAHPSGPADGKQELVPGTGMYAHADDKGAEANTSIAKPALPTIPIPTVPIPTGLVAVEAFSSKSKTVIEGDKVTATAYATAGSLSLLGGMVVIHGLRTESTASSNGVSATKQSKVTWTSLTVAGQTFAATQDGITSPAGVTPMPTLPADVQRRMADFGLTIQPPKVDSGGEGAAATVAGRGLTVTLDTATFKNKLGLGSILDPFLALLPADLRTQLSPWLALAPKFVFMVGTSRAEATATPAFTGEPLPPIDGGSSGGGGFGSGGGGTGGDLGTGTGDTPTPVANGRQWPVFPGVPWYLFVLGLGVAVATSFGLRKYVAMMFAAIGCELGASNGIPNLRER